MLVDVPRSQAMHRICTEPSARMVCCCLRETLCTRFWNVVHRLLEYCWECKSQKQHVQCQVHKCNPKSPLEFVPRLDVARSMQSERQAPSKHCAHESSQILRTAILTVVCKEGSCRLPKITILIPSKDPKKGAKEERKGSPHLYRRQREHQNAEHDINENVAVPAQIKTRTS